MPAIQVRNTVMQYKNGVKALSGINLTVEEGEIFTLLGENGAGKSTLIRILTTYLPPTSGEICIFGTDILKHAQKVRTELSCVAQKTSIDKYLSLEENMMFQSRLYKIPRAEALKRMAQLITDFGLERYMRYPVSSYSGGIKRRLDIALNMMSNPRILFLDEPTVGMDIQSRMAMWEMMKKLRARYGTTIFLTTHYLEEADRLSDSVCIMKDGKEVIQGSPAELRSYIGQDTIEIVFSSAAEARGWLAAIRAEGTFEHVRLQEQSVVFDTADSRGDMDRAARYLLREQVPFMKLEIAQPTLEDVFLRITGKSVREGLR